MPFGGVLLAPRGHVQLWEELGLPKTDSEEAVVYAISCPTEPSLCCTSLQGPRARQGLAFAKTPSKVHLGHMVAAALEITQSREAQCAGVSEPSKEKGHHSWALCLGLPTYHVGFQGCVVQSWWCQASESLRGQLATGVPLSGCGRKQAVLISSRLRECFQLSTETFLSAEGWSVPVPEWWTAKEWKHSNRGVSAIIHQQSEEGWNKWYLRVFPG
jgi:hypothetical protein